MQTQIQTMRFELPAGLRAAGSTRAIEQELARDRAIRRGCGLRMPRFRNATPPINPLLYAAPLPIGQDAPYYDLAVVKGNVFTAAPQAAVTCGAGLSATVATISLSNNLLSGKNCAILQVSWAFSAAPAAAVVVYLVGGFSSTTNVTHTTPLSVYQGVVGAAVTPGTGCVGRADTAATLPATPVVLGPVANVVAASSLTPVPAFIDLKGALVVQPGGYVAIQASAACSGFAAITWMEY